MVPQPLSFQAGRQPHGWGALIFQLHTLSAFVLFALWPFSSLVHVFSVPLGYLRRSYVQYRSSNPQATLARERASKVAKKRAKAEQGSHIE